MSRSVEARWKFVRSWIVVGSEFVRSILETGST